MTRRFEENVRAIYVTDDAKTHALTEQICDAFPLAERISVADRDAAVACHHGSQKRGLVLTTNRGKFIKPFPRHPWYQYDHMYNLILGFNCFASCQYCFIHTYFSDALPTWYVNRDDMMRELGEFVEHNPRAWISTGEFIDSLQLDQATQLTRDLLHSLSPFPDITFELRTKHQNVQHLPLPAHPGALISFSINPDVVTQRVEGGSASLHERLTAARWLLDNGYRVAFRIDPIVLTETHGPSYQNFVADVDRAVPLQRVWKVFLGALRFDDDMLRHLASGHGSQRLLHGNFVTSPDGKFRPFKQERVDVYRALLADIRRVAPNTNIELVMEPQYVHDRVFAS